MSSLVRLGTLDDPKGALVDLRRSLDLDSQNLLATRLLTSLEQFGAANHTQVLLPGRDPRPFDAEVARLRTQQQIR